jgi:hypothetical protein
MCSSQNVKAACVFTSSLVKIKTTVKGVESNENAESTEKAKKA